MPEAGWLLLLLFLGCCSLIAVAMLWPSFRRIQQRTLSVAAHASPSAPAPSPPTALPPTTLPPPAIAPPKEETPTPTPVTVRTLPIREWLTIVNDRPDDAPHTLIIGTSGSGKTTLAQAIIAARSGYLVILDPKWRPGNWGGLPAIPIDDDGRYTQLEEGIKALLAELNARLVWLKQGTTVFADVTIVAEEFPTLITECPSAATLFKQIGRLGRELHIRILGLSQSERVKSLGISGEGDALDNYTLIRLGKAAINTLSEARTQERPAVLAWRGENTLMDLSTVVNLARRPIDVSRSWALGGAGTSMAEESAEKGAQEKAEDTSDKMFLSFSAEELGKIAVMIIQGVQRGKAIRAMPRYARKQHKEFAAFYDRLKEVMDDAQKGS